MAGELLDAVKDGKPILDLRIRLEAVDQSNLHDDGYAPTLRTRLGWQTKAYKGWSLTIDMEDITVLGDDTYNSTNNGATHRPVVADPEDTELNRVHLTYKNDRRAFVLGRQRIKLDNDRFIGNVGWRQNEQTFDALTWQESISEKVTLTTAWVANVNRIFGEHHGNDLNANLRTSTFIGHLAFPAGPLGKASLFTHLIDLDDLPAASHANYGIRITGKWKTSDSLAFTHEISYAKQQDYADGNENIDNDYYMLSFGPKFGAFSITANREVLGGNGEAGFATPLATLHAFNGWSDRFLSTPAVGLVDDFLKVIWKSGPWKAGLFYHQFESDEGSIDFGDEINLLLTRKLGKGFDCGLKYADFNGDSVTVDVQKLWLWLHFKL